MSYERLGEAFECFVDLSPEDAEYAVRSLVRATGDAPAGSSFAVTATASHGQRRLWLSATSRRRLVAAGVPGGRFTTGPDTPDRRKWTELDDLRAALHLEPGQKICGAKKASLGREVVCLLPQHGLATWHEGCGGAWYGGPVDFGDSDRPE